MTPDIRKNLNRRFLPLYFAAFFQGFSLWYAIEKLFMRNIGFDNGTIGIAIAITSVFILLAETPSGILADRWSRKGVLILASISLAMSSAVGGLSNNIPAYFIVVGFWGIFFALYSGAYDAIVYDTLLEVTGKGKLFERYYGKVQLVDGIALALGSLLGGVAGELLGLRSAYFLTVIFALLGGAALLLFKEPRLHKAHVAESIKQHVINTINEVVKNRTLLPVLIVLIILTALRAVLFEFQQFWLIALAAPVFVFGPANALVFSTIALGGLAASYLKMHRAKVMLITILFILIATLGLIIFRKIFAIVASQVLFGTCVIGAHIVFSRFLHDSLPSKVRSGSSSVVNTLSRLVIIPLAVVFGFISKEASVFMASWLILGLLLVAGVFVIKTFSAKRKLKPVTLGDELLVEPYNK